MRAQFATAATPLHNSATPYVGIPEPIYWKQMLFQIPYQWDTTADPAAAQAVWLLVSKDRGSTWQKISEARPHVKSFNYRAEAEGEYWFAVRTIDSQGRPWPAGEYQPELRVIVDTTMPRIEALQANPGSDGTLELQWHGSDLNLDPSSWRIEAQDGPAGNWQIVPLEAAASAQPQPQHPLPSDTRGPADCVSTGRTVWRPSGVVPPTAIRATVFDRAGNSATFHTQVKPPQKTAAYQRLPPTGASGPASVQPPSTALFEAPGAAVSELASRDAFISSPGQGWISSSTAAEVDPAERRAGDQVWPPTSSHAAPFRLSGTDAFGSQDAVTAYGIPAVADGPRALNGDGGGSDEASATSARYAMNMTLPGSPAMETQSNAATEPAFQPIPAFRQPAVTPAPDLPAHTPLAQENVAPPAVEVVGQNRPPLLPDIGPVPAAFQPKWVGSRTFALEYELEQVGRLGVSSVELWGTRDGGQTWRRYARDDDQRSPLVVTVDEEGLYGFRIVVESSGDVSARPPASGDEPELWVAVDLNRPVAELTAIEPGAGNMADHLTLRWRANDDHFDPRPISLFYSSQPAGPWSAIATNLQNTSEYAWRVERHVPSRFYLRLEARDTAGNLAAFQTRDPIEFTLPAASGHLRSVTPTDPTATGGTPSYR